MKMKEIGWRGEARPWYPWIRQCPRPVYTEHQGHVCNAANDIAPFNHLKICYTPSGLQPQINLKYRSIDADTGNRLHFLLFQVHIYRPQRSCGKVMFLHLSVILFTGGGCLHLVRGTCPLGRHPPGQDTLPGRHPTSLGRHPPAQCMLGYTHLPTQCMLGYGQQVDSAHPTGMHSCLQKVQLVFDYWNRLHFYFSKYILFKKFNLYMLQ